MYTIIGADGAEYGPVSEAQVRAWMQAGRADLHTRIRRSGETEWSTIADLPEFTGTSHEPPPIPGGRAPLDEASSAAEIAEAIAARGGRIDIGNAYERAWAVLKEHFWPIVGVSFVIVVLVGIAQQVLASAMGIKQMGASDDPVEAARALSSTFLWAMPVLSVVHMLFVTGLQYYYLMHLRGEKPTLGDAFKGFTRTLPIIGTGFVMLALISLGALVFILPGIYLAVAFSYAPLLVLDKGLPPLKALEVSRRLVSRQWFTLFGLLILYVLLMVAGFCALIIGVFVTLPLVRLAMVCAYEDLVNPKR